MIDLSGFEEKQKREKELQKAVQEIMDMPRETLQEKLKTVTEYFDTITPFVDELHYRMQEGEQLSEEELHTLDECEKAAKHASDFILLAQHGLMKKLTAYADSVYYAIKKEAENGNKEAQKKFEELKVLKQNAIRSEISNNDN